MTRFVLSHCQLDLSKTYLVFKQKEEKMTVLHIHSLQDRNSDLKHQQSTLRKQWSNGSEALKQTT